jgi:hypothetical protein
MTRRPDGLGLTTEWSDQFGQRRGSCEHPLFFRGLNLDLFPMLLSRQTRRAMTAVATLLGVIALSAWAALFICTC